MYKMHFLHCEHLQKYFLIYLYLSISSALQDKQFYQTEFIKYSSLIVIIKLQYYDETVLRINIENFIINNSYSYIMEFNLSQ